MQRAAVEQDQHFINTSGKFISDPKNNSPANPIELLPIMTDRFSKMKG